MYYTKLCDDEVAAAYWLFRFLEKLKIIGHLKVHTEQGMDKQETFDNYLVYHFSDHQYSLVKDGYTSEPRCLDAIEEIERILNREFKRFNP